MTAPSGHDPVAATTPSTTGEATTPSTTGDATTGELLARLSEDVRGLVRSELQLARVEMTAKARETGMGVGMFGAAGVIALYGLGVLIATVVLALALVLDAWLAALIVGVVLVAIAGIAAMVGRGRVQHAAPLAPTETVDNVKQDVETVKRAARS